MIKALSTRQMMLAASKWSKQGFASTADPRTGDCIKLLDMVFYGHIGALPEEKTLGQRFHVDVNVYRDLRKAGVSDALGETSDYGRIYEQVKAVMEGTRFDLLEKAAETIASHILEDQEVTAVELEIRKPSVPIPGVLGASAVRIVRYQDWRPQI